MDGYTFSISYFSEVTADITLDRFEGNVRLSATHPRVTISDWFHFSEVEMSADPLVVEGNDFHQVFFEMGAALYPGARGLLKRADGIDDPRTQFFTDLYLAFVYGEWIPAWKMYPTGWDHDVGERITERFI